MSEFQRFDTSVPNVFLVYMLPLKLLVFQLQRRVNFGWFIVWPGHYDQLSCGLRIPSNKCLLPFSAEQSLPYIRMYKSNFETRISSKKFEVDLYNKYSFQVVGTPEIMRLRAGILYDNGEKTMFVVSIRHDGL